METSIQSTDAAGTEAQPFSTTQSYRRYDSPDHNWYVMPDMAPQEREAVQLRAMQTWQVALRPQQSYLWALRASEQTCMCANLHLHTRPIRSSSRTCTSPCSWVSSGCRTLCPATRCARHVGMLTLLCIDQEQCVYHPVCLLSLLEPVLKPITTPLGSLNEAA